MYIPVVYWLRFCLVRHWLLLFHSAVARSPKSFLFHLSLGH